MALPSEQEKSRSRITLMSSRGSAEFSNPSRYQTTAIDILPGNSAAPNWSPGRPSSAPQQLPRRQYSRKKRMILAAGISLVVFILVAGAVIGTYFGVISAHRATFRDFPGSLEKDGPPSESVLGVYTIQSVAADTAECSKVGNEILLKNGSAAEAAIAATLCAGLYHPHSCGIGGGFFIVLYNRTTGIATAIDARESAPAAATELMFVDPVDKNISSIRGWHSIGVPGEIAGYWEIFQQFGSGNIKWEELFEPAIKLARDGVIVNSVLARAIASSGEDIRTYDEGFGDIFIKNKMTGELYVAGDLIKYPKLAETLQTIAKGEEGVREFYQGKIAADLIADINAGKGIISLADLKNYKVNVKEALHSKLHDNSSVYGVPPPSGGLVLQYIINIMDGYGYNNTWQTMSDDDKILFYQRFTEAMKFAYARRTELGDEHFVPEVTQMKETLLSPWFGRLTRNAIDDSRTSNDTRTYGVKVVPSIGKVGTSHISIIDKNGNAASITSSVNTFFGARKVSKRTGIILNNGMDDFTANPYQANYYGLPPSPSNLIVPGKRAQSSMAPTIVTDSKGDVKVVLGASGGSRIITAIANVLLRVLYLGQDVKEAIDAPRIHHQLLPMGLDYEPNFVRKHLEGLAEKGHEMALSDTTAVLQGVTRLEDMSLEANCDFRKKGAPAGV